MRWIVGLDLRPTSGGALHYARWLVRSSVDCNARADVADTLVGAHVVERRHLERALRSRPARDVIDRIRLGIDASIHEVGVEGILEDLVIEIDPDAPQRLLRMVVEHEATGVVIGREPERPHAASSRLGPVTRNLLRQARVPVIVVPAELRAPSPDGPVMVATSLEEDAVEAARFAAAFAATHGRGLEYCHVVPDPDEVLAPYLPSKELDAVGRQSIADARERFAQWRRAFGLTEGEFRVQMGETIERLVDTAADRSASLLVTGSRDKSALERFFVGSVAHGLASHAPCPVAIVGPSPSA